MRSRYHFLQDSDSLYFITMSIVEFIPIFTNTSYFNILIKNMEFYRKRDKMLILYYIIMDNHLHMIVHSPIISKTIQDFKKYTAKQIIEALQYDKRKWILPLLQQYKKQHKIHSIHQVWQEGSHPEKIVNEIMLNQKIDYIHKNPIKRGFVTEDCHWLYSSARNTQNLSAPIQVDTIDDFIGLDCE